MSATLGLVIGTLVALVGSGGIVFTALRFGREEATGLVAIMRDLNDELQEALERTRKQRDELAAEVDRLHEECKSLRIEIHKLRVLIGKDPPRYGAYES
jgi:cell division protein FtsB